MTEQRMSLRLVSQQEDEMKSGRLKGGATLTLRVEGILKPEEIVGKSCIVKFWEVDREDRQGDQGPIGQKEDILAVYSARILENRPPPEPRYSFTDVRRIWPEEEEKLPEPQAAYVRDPNFKHDDLTFRPLEWSNTAGYVALDYRPEWKPPHFLLRFETGAREGALGSATDPAVVLIKGDAREREGYIYEIAFDLLVEDVPQFRSDRLSPTELDCTNFLTHNCKTAMLMMRAHQEDAIRKRGIGLYYGSRYWLQPRDEAEYRRLGVKSTDCVTYLMAATELGHQKTQAGEEWAFAMEQYRSHERRKRRSGEGGGSGMHIADRLVRLGWQGLYFNRDTQNPEDGQDYHKDEWKSARRRRKYLGIPVVDLVVNYAPNPRGKTPRNPSNKYRLLKGIPFGIVMLKYGMHTAMYGEGSIYEAHWTVGARPSRDLSGTPVGDPLFDATPLDNYGWVSGLIVVPPGQWDLSRVRVVGG